MLKDSFSPLYSGFVTCKLDSTFSKNFPDENSNTERYFLISALAFFITHFLYEFFSTTLFSTDENVLQIMNKYKDVALPMGFMDISHFVIYLSFEGQVRPLLVPNPLLLRKKFCNVWPFEIKQALGVWKLVKNLHFAHSMI